MRLPAIGFRALYFNCEPVKYEEFWTRKIKDWQPDSAPAFPQTFSELLPTPPTDKPLVLLLDEADKLVPEDRERGWPIFKQLRDVANSGDAQFVLSGESTLLQALQDPHSPLFNFANRIALSRLDPRAVEHLVTQPMKQLDIEFVDEATVVNAIYEFTSGHPNVVQRLCIRLIKRINDLEVRRITPDDVKAVVQDPEFLKEDFLDTYWEGATRLEKIISLLMANDAACNTLRALQQTLSDRYKLAPKTREIQNALQRLVNLRSILKRLPEGYAFAVTAFPQVVARNHDPRGQLDRTRRGIR